MTLSDGRFLILCGMLLGFLLAVAAQTLDEALDLPHVLVLVVRRDHTHESHEAAPVPAPETPASAAHAVRKGQREAPKVQEADA